MTAWVASVSRGCTDGVSTASWSSTGPACACGLSVWSCQVDASTSRRSVSSRTANPARARCTAIDAAAVTAHSSDDPGPLPSWATTRVSSSTVARLCQGCSSRRTISSPVRAVLRQCTRRRSSPSRYSRTVTSSADPVAKARGRRSPVPDHSLVMPTCGNVCTAGVTTSRVVAVNVRTSSIIPNGSLTRTESGPTS